MMKYYSDVLNKVFETEKELRQAEKTFEEKKQKELEAAKEAEAKQLKLKEERESRAKEIEEAIKTRDEAQKKVNELTNAFIRDYGSWHYTLKKNFVDGVLEDFFKFW